MALSKQRLDGSSSPGFLFAEEGSSAALEILEQAMHGDADSSSTEALLLNAQATDPECLQVYFALYKFYFYHKSFDDAERAARQGLAVAARQGGVPIPGRVEYTECRLVEPERSTAFLPLQSQGLGLHTVAPRRQQRERANTREIVRTGPRDSIGASVLRQLASARVLIPPGGCGDSIAHLRISAGGLGPGCMVQKRRFADPACPCYKPAP